MNTDDITRALQHDANSVTEDQLRGPAHRRPHPEPRNAKPRWALAIVAAATVAAIAVGITTAVADRTQVSDDRPNPSIASPVSTTAEPSPPKPGGDEVLIPRSDTILAAAHRAAQANNDAAPTSITWVYTSAGTASKVMGLGIVQQAERERPGVLIMVKGSFILTSNAHRAPGFTPVEPPAHESTILLFLDTAKGDVTAFSLNDAQIDLAPYGRIYQG